MNYFRLVRSVHELKSYVNQIKEQEINYAERINTNFPEIEFPSIICAFICYFKHVNGTNKAYVDYNILGRTTIRKLYYSCFRKKPVIFGYPNKLIVYTDEDLSKIIQYMSEIHGQNPKLEALDEILESSIRSLKEASTIYKPLLVYVLIRPYQISNDPHSNVFNIPTPIIMTHEEAYRYMQCRPQKDINRYLPRGNTRTTYIDNIVSVFNNISLKSIAYKVAPKKKIVQEDATIKDQGLYTFKIGDDTGIHTRLRRRMEYLKDKHQNELKLDIDNHLPDVYNRSKTNNE